MNFYKIVAKTQTGTMLINCNVKTRSFRGLDCSGNALGFIVLENSGKYLSVPLSSIISAKRYKGRCLGTGKRPPVKTR